jgi:hypothetical protein
MGRVDKRKESSSWLGSITESSKSMFAGTSDSTVDIVTEEEMSFRVGRYLLCEE